MRKTVGVIWLAFEICCYSLGLLLFVPFLFSYNQLKTFGDTLSKDGSLESFTFVRYQVIHWPAQTLDSCCLPVLLTSLYVDEWFKPR